MFGKISICEAKSFPLFKTETILGNDKLLNSQLHRTGRFGIIRSEHINTDISGAIYAENGGVYGFKAIPTIKNDDGYKYVINKSLEKAWEIFANLGFGMKGFLCGGVCQPGEAKYSPYSYELYCKIADFFDEKQIPFNMICGKKNINAEDNVSFHKDKIYMWGDYIGDCFNLKRGYYHKDEKIIGKLPELYNDVVMLDNKEFEVIRDIK